MSLIVTTRAMLVSNCERFVVATLLIACVMGAPRAFSASAYQVPMDASTWTAETSVFACRLSQDIPLFGGATFERLAGEEAKFLLNSLSPRLASGKAMLKLKAPAWKPESVTRELGYVDVTQGRLPITVVKDKAERMLEALQHGLDVEFTRAAWFGGEESLRVRLSTINFRAPYERYLQCLAQLLPVNFDQIRRTSIFFAPGAADLPASEEVKLDNIAIYVRADESVESFYIDGHTDSDGTRSDNLELAKKRAEMVHRLLVERGIPPEKITTRWHGERYPVASNRSAGGRAKNRRVTIRLEKNDEGTLPSLASSR